MAQLLQAFNAQQYDPTQGVGGLPVGKHPVVIESSEVKANSKNDGGYLQLNLKIIDGPSAGSVGAYRLNLYHQNQQTVEIAHRQLSAVCHVIGVFNVQDTQQLHNIPFVVEVDFQKGEEARQKGYTEVKRVFDINGNEPGKAGQGQQQAQPQGFGQQAAHAPQQAAAPAGGPAWGGQAPAAQPPAQAPQGQQPAWGGGQAQQPAQSPAWGQPAAGGWQQGAAQAPQGGAPWGAR